MKTRDIYWGGLILLTAGLLSNQNTREEDRPQTYVLPEDKIPRGWNYQNNQLIFFPDEANERIQRTVKGIPYPSEREVQWIRKNLPPDQYLYTPGNPYNYRTTQDYIEEYIEDNIDEIRDYYDH